MRSTLLTLSCFCLLIGSTAPLLAQGKGARARLGILYKKTLTGDRHLAGVEEALENWKARDGRTADQIVEVQKFPYDNESDGVDKLIDAAKNGEADIMLGPTESGVYVRAQRRGADPKKPIVVISPLVTAQTEQDPDGWFFRTNVDVSRRAQAIYDVMSKRRVSSTAILYQDTEFGRVAETAFRREFERAWPIANYLPLPFSDFLEARNNVREVLGARPEAVGIFAERHHILDIYHSMVAQNAKGVPYEPLLFSLIDVRVIAEQLNLQDFYFVSVVESTVPEKVSAFSNQDFWDDIKALSYDTTCFVLDALAGLPARDRAVNVESFRKRFAALLEGGTGHLGERTDMHFAGFVNKDIPEVFHLSQQEITQVPHTEALTLLQQIRFKAELLSRRFGYQPIGIAIVLFLTSFGMTFSDVHRWYGGKRRVVLGNVYFLAFATGMGLFVVAVYGFLAETGRIAYDSLFAGLLIALAPAAVLKSTWFETSAGKAIGFRSLYNSALLWFNDKMMAQFYWDKTRFLNVLSFFNSLPFLKDRLNGMYDSARNQERREALKERLRSDLEKADTSEEKKLICARRLLRRWKWEELVTLGCVPLGYEVAGEVRDPAVFIRRSERFCGTAGISSGDLDDRIQDLIKNVADETKENYKSKLEAASQEPGKRYTQIRFLVETLGYKEDKLRELGFLPRRRLGEILKANEVVDDEQIQKALKRQTRQRRRRRKGGLFGECLVNLKFASTDQITQGLQQQKVNA